MVSSIENGTVWRKRVVPQVPKTDVLNNGIVVLTGIFQKIFIEKNNAFSV